MNKAEQERAAVGDALPDFIDTFRLIRRAGRSDKAKAEAISAIFEKVRAHLQENSHG